MLPGADGPRGEMVARRVLDRLRAIKVEARGQREPLRISVGLAAWTANATPSTMLTRARAAAERSANGETGRPGRRRRRTRGDARRRSRPRRLHNSSQVLTGSELWLLRLMADRGLALLDASNMLLLIEEKGELRVAGASGGPVRLRIAPVQGSALGALYQQGESVAIEQAARPGGGVPARTGARGALGAGRAVLDGGSGRRRRDRAAPRRLVPQARPRGAEGVRGERRAAARRGALGRDRTAALRDGGARARAHALGARDPRRVDPGHRRPAHAARQRTRPRRQGGARGRGRGGARGARAPRSTACAT